MPRRSWCLLLALGVLSPAARADVKVHPIFSDNMVLQRDMEIVVWGTSDDDNIVWGTSGDDGPVFPADETETLPNVDLEFGDLVVTGGVN